MMEIEIGQPLDLGLALESGQAFRWTRHNGSYEGILDGHRVRLCQTVKETETAVLQCWTSNGEEARPLLESYFRLDDDFDEIRTDLSRDVHMSDLVRKLHGLRLLRQDPWECLTSFVLSQACNIPRISGMIDRLCRSYGDTHTSNGEAAAFPTAEELAGTSEGALRALGLGFRAPYVLNIARNIVDNPDFLSEMSSLSYSDAREKLTSLPGVGPKVADCVLLFACDHLDAFPVDVWVRRAVRKAYLKNRDAPPHAVSEFGQRRFGRFAGYAQQYLFVDARSKQRKRQLAA